MLMAIYFFILILYIILLSLLPVIIIIRCVANLPIRGERGSRDIKGMELPQQLGKDFVLNSFQFIYRGGEND